MHVDCILAVKLASATCLVGQDDLVHRDVCARRVPSALELGDGCLGAGDDAPLAGRAAHSLERNVGEQRARVAVRLLTRERAV